MWTDNWVDRQIPEDEWPIVHDSPMWYVRILRRRTACDNRPGLKKFYIKAFGENGKPLGGVRIGFDTEPGDSGTIYNHPNIYGHTGTRHGREGYAEWQHFGVPTRYMMWVDGGLLIEHIRTDLPNEYCKLGRWPWEKRGYNPVNRPGIYSYDIEVQRR